jgi:imidazoleglycerol-phosphate dehydratase
MTSFPITARCRLGDGHGVPPLIVEFGSGAKLRPPLARRKPKPRWPIGLRLAITGANGVEDIIMRKGAITRKTKETSIEVGLDLDGSGVADVTTGIGFFDHMLDQLARHSLIDIKIRAEGDRHIDDHHTVEDVGIALGQALAKALGEKRGLTRYAHCLLPMDETLTRVALDVSGRPFLVFRTEFPTEKIGAFDTQLVREFFQAFAGNGGLTLHVETLYGANSHHIAESCFKGVARALRDAVAIDARQAERVPSTKGAL